MVAKLACGCGGDLMPTERMRIEWVQHGRHGHYEKAGIPLDGSTCGEQYQRAVAGVPPAEELMQRCSDHNAAYGVLMTSFVVVPLTSLLVGFELDSHPREIVIGSGLVVGLASFLVGVWMGYLGGQELHDAVHLYDAQTPH